MWALVMLARLRSAASLANPGLTPLPFAPAIRRLLCDQDPGTQPPSSTLNTQHRPHRRLALRAFTSPPANYKHSLDHTQIDAMVSFTAILLLAGAVMHAQAQDFTDLVGTWSSKSNSTFTGDVRKQFLPACGRC